MAARGNATFSALASGSPIPTYNWQISTNGGATWSNLSNGGVYAGVTTTALTIAGVTAGMNGYEFRCLATNTISSASSGAADSDRRKRQPDDHLCPACGPDLRQFDFGVALGATASSGLPVSYSSSNLGVATISGNCTVTIIGAGAATIIASQAGNASYAAAPSVTQVLTVNLAGQTIAFGALAARTSGSPAFALSAVASSGLPVSYSSSNPSVATVSGGTVTIVGAGVTSITASQVGNPNYECGPCGGSDPDGKPGQSDDHFRRPFPADFWPLDVRAGRERQFRFAGELFEFQSRSGDDFRQHRHDHRRRHRHDHREPGGECQLCGGFECHPGFDGEYGRSDDYLRCPCRPERRHRGLCLDRLRQLRFARELFQLQSGGGDRVRRHGHDREAPAP